MSMNNPRRRPDRDRRGRPDYCPPYYDPYPYQQPYPFDQRYGLPYQRQCPYYQPIPAPYIQPTPALPEPASCPQGSMPYEVQSGDTLENIANHLGSSTQAIMALNPNVNFSIPLRNGQTICLPMEQE